MKMEEVAFQDWPGQPVDLNSGSNPWTPAYGFQTPPSLLEKEDFIGNPDAEYFLHGSTSSYMYLETIQEETSDDLRSESEIDSRNSPLGWLATDSEDGSVICIDPLDDIDCDSERELACPPKRRRQENYHTTNHHHEDEEEISLSRSSSLLQFETLEKECQQDSHSPSRFSSFSFDSLEVCDAKKEFSVQDFSPEYDGEFFKTFGNEIIRSKQNASRDSLLYNASNRYSSSDSSDSDTTVEGQRSCDNLTKTWRSFDSLPLTSSGATKKFSSENLSEDSGYGDQLLLTSLTNTPPKSSNLLTNLSSSLGNLAEEVKRHDIEIMSEEKKVKKNSYVGFGAYDCEIYQNFNNNFGASYQDLSVFDRYDPFNKPLSKSSPLTDVFLRKKQARSNLLTVSHSAGPHAINLNINIDTESKFLTRSNFNHGVSHAASVPNLLENTDGPSVDIQDSIVNVYSVPKDLNFIGEFYQSSARTSVAEQNWNLADLNFGDLFSEQFSDKVSVDILGDKLYDISVKSPKLASLLPANNDNLVSIDGTMANYRREGSYTEAMGNRVDLSDDENSLLHKKKLPKHPIIDFDKKVLKAISEQSLQSLLGSNASLHGSQICLEKPVMYRDKLDFATSTPVKRNQYNSVAISTPDLNRFEPVQRRDRSNPYFDDDRRKSTQEISSSSKYDATKVDEERAKNILLDCSNDEEEVVYRRKGSIIKSSTSTSGMSDIDERTLRNSVRSFNGSSSSKGVHFSPVVAEVNWRDDASNSTATPERESSYSLDSSSPEPIRSSPNPKLVKPRARYPKSQQQARRSVSQPDLSEDETKHHKKEFVESLNTLRNHDSMSKSQPDVSKFKRRGSQLVKKDRDGCTIKAYIDADGVQYQHSHLDLKSLSNSSLYEPSSSPVAKPSATVPPAAASKNSITSKFPFNHHHITSNDDHHQILREENNRQQSTASTSSKQLNNSAKQSNIVAMNDVVDDDDAAARTRKGHKKSGLGGFLQRLASFRLGAKKGHDQKEKLKRKAQGNGTAATAQPNLHRGPTSTTTSSTTKPDYIYIPLKGPTSSHPVDNNNTNPGGIGGPAVVSSKPPLPKQPPPRVVHASVKKTAPAQNPNGPPPSEDRRRRRTIDSGSVGVARDVGRNDGDASMDGPMGLIETDLDTEVTVITNGANAKARSLLDLGPEPRLQIPQNANGQQNHPGRPHKSMEFLLDKQNLKVVEPPENELQKTERVMSEHELRVQRSLQKLTIPDWYKNSQVPGQGFLLKKNSLRETRWTGTGSKTTSLSSLGSGAQSPLILSPTPSNQPFVRWSTSKLNSTASSPCQSTRSSFNQGRQPNGSISPSSARSSFSYRQPYMGWRSQERLNRPRTPAERLASSILTKQQPNSTVQQESPEIQTSIKEVTSAIVHYVSGLKPNADVDNLDNHSHRSSSVSPRGSQKLCWLESSFVGTKPLDSPETPVTCSESPVPSHGMRLDLQNHSNNDLAMLSTGDSKVRPSPSSTTLEDVLDSLLGLPSSGRAPSPGLQETVSANTSPQRRLSDEGADGGGTYRRRSEGSEPASGRLDPTLPTPVVLRCRYSRCGKTALPASKEAEAFKNCHNCSYTYCSRACRRSHWERHRKTCLFSRMGTLCRQVIAAAKEKKESLKELSKVARRGYLSHGPGAVKCFFPNPESAEKFLAEGLPGLGELTFVRWQDLLPSEMGPLLYEEMVNMCKNYNSETKFVLYVSICVVSETPASGAVKWERQLVSRCAKMRLCKDLGFIGPEREIPDTPETLILTCTPIRLPTPETTQRARIIAVDNLQTQLRARGVSLKRQYPEIYRQLDSYSDDLSVRLETQTIYPKNAITNKSFMCIIMLESDLETLKHVEKAGVRVKTIDVLLCNETTPL